MTASGSIKRPLMEVPEEALEESILSCGWRRPGTPSAPEFITRRVWQGSKRTSPEERGVHRGSAEKESRN